MKKTIKIAIVSIILLIVILLVWFYFVKNLRNNKPSEESIPQEENQLLESVCKKAISDYPEWVKNTGLVVWQDLKKEGGFFFRKSPKDATVTIQSPANDNQELLDIDLIDSDTLGFVLKDFGQRWQVGLFNLNNANKQYIFEKNESIDIFDAAFIDKEKFLILLNRQDKITLDYIEKNGQQETLAEFKLSGKKDKDFRVKVSPKTTYASTIIPDSIGLVIFSLSDNKQVKEIKDVESAVWLGDSHILYAIKDSQVFLYDIEKDQSYKIIRPDFSPTKLSFNPLSEGIIAFSINNGAESKTQISSCQNWQILGTQKDATIESFTDKDTVLITKNVGDSSIKGNGFWQFTNDWIVKLSDGFDSNGSHLLMATPWSQY